MEKDTTSGAPVAPVFVSEFCAARSRKFVLIAAILASSMGFIDGSVVSIALPAMRETLGASLAQAQWIHNAYMLTLSALILVGGAMGDRIGLARVFKLGIIIFVATSLLCAVAPTAPLLIAARLLQGIGAAMMVPGSLAIISRAYPREERGRAIGTWAAMAAVTTALGPIIGGLALTFGGAETWRWIFAVNLPFGIIAIALLNRHVDADPHMENRTIDWAGAIVATVGLGALAYGLSASQGHGTAAVFSAALGVAAVCFIAFLWIERRAPAPMMPLGMFANGSFAVTNLVTFTVYFGLSAILFFLPMLVIAGWGETEITAAAAFAPLSVFIAGLSTLSGKWADKVGPAPLIGTGAIIAGLGYAALGLTLPAQDFWGRVLPSMSVMAAGMGLLVAPLSTALMASVTDELGGTASGSNNAISRIAGLIAVASMGSLAAWVYARSGGPLSFGIVGDVAVHLPAMQRAFQAVCWTAAGMCFLSGILAFVGIKRAVDQASSKPL